MSNPYQSPKEEGRKLKLDRRRVAIVVVVMILVAAFLAGLIVPAFNKAKEHGPRYQETIEEP